MDKLTFKRTKTDRYDAGYIGVEIHNESNKLPGHEKRMIEHEKRIQKEKGRKWEQL